MAGDKNNKGKRRSSPRIYADLHGYSFLLRSFVLIRVDPRLSAARKSFCLLPFAFCPLPFALLSFAFA
jgi:hypothetical protein